ncbi:MAG: ATP-binding cassette domain-containing protein, partial [Paracoccaceae bacterium]|nr:ATP-binding cassette domain-containing protein [Paracoccaceae bacterium]
MTEETVQDRIQSGERMLELKDVELYYDHVYALRSISIYLNQGETVALIGANGAGKSSILKAITGLAKIHSGSMTYQGQD